MFLHCFLIFFLQMLKRPGGVYTVKISSVIKGRRLKSNPVRFIMSRYSSAGLAALEENLYRTTTLTQTLTASASSSSAASASSMETSSLPAVLLPPLSPSHPSGQVHRNNRLTGTNFSSVGGGDYRFPPTNYSAGVVYVRGEEVGIVVLVLIGKLLINSECIRVLAPKRLVILLSWSTTQNRLSHAMAFSLIRMNVN